MMTLNIEGMTCAACEAKIERKLRATPGVKTAKVSYARGKAQIEFDPGAVSASDIEKIIDKLGYKVAKRRTSGALKGLGALIILFALYMIMRHIGFLNVFNAFPLAEEGMGYGMLFVIGLLTSVHCVSMCGGINISQCMAHASGMRSSFLYNLGRVISYTVVGFIVGAIGSVVSFSGAMKGAVQLAAGVFMVVMGLNMLGIFPWLRRLAPRMPRAFARGIHKRRANGNGPLYVGLLNGLMPCGPLQAMQLYALSTGDPVKGALSMLLFSVGTVPLMFGLGAVSSMLSRKYADRIMMVGAALVVVMGVSMFQSGMALTGVPAPVVTAEVAAPAKEVAEVEDVQIVETQLSPRGYEPITVKAGIPVKWIIHAEDGAINGCNNELYIPEYNVSKRLSVGDNIIEFMPEKSGTFPYSCWMGMIRSSITVK